MLLDKDTYKERMKSFLLSPDRVNKTINCCGHTGINDKSVADITFTVEGIYISLLIGKKAFISYNDVFNVDIDSNILFIDSHDVDAQHVKFIFNKKDCKTANQIFYTLREKLGNPVPEIFKKPLNLPLIKEDMTIKKLNEKIKLMETGEIYCPKCLSTKIVATPKKTRSIFHNDVAEITCLNCGNIFRPGQK